MTPEQENDPSCVVDSCCCGCFTLKTGCHILGLLHLIGVIGGLGFTVFLSVSVSPFFLIGTILFASIMIFNCYFIYGVQNEIVKYVRAWLYFIVFFIIMDIIGSIQSIISGQEKIIAFIVNATFQIYVIIVINSYKHQLLQKQNVTSLQGAESGTTRQNEETLTSLPANEYRMNSGQQTMAPPVQCIMTVDQEQPMGPLDANQLMMNPEQNQRYLVHLQPLPEQPMMTYPGEQNKKDTFGQCPAYQPMYPAPNYAASRDIAPPAYSEVAGNNQQSKENTEQSKDKTEENQ